MKQLQACLVKVVDIGQGNLGAKLKTQHVFHIYMWKTIFIISCCQGFTGVFHIMLVIISTVCLKAYRDLRILP